jgi:hypothetical protein
MKLGMPIFVAVASMVLLVTAQSGRAETEATDGTQPDLSWDAADTDCGPGGDDWASGRGEPCWTVTADALFLVRRQPAASTLITHALDRTEILNASAFDFPAHAGVDVSLSRHFGCNRALVVRCFGSDEWNAVVAMPTTFGDLLQVNTVTPIFASAGTAVGAQTTSSLQNLEINASRQWWDCLTLLIGFRYVELDERFSATVTGVSDPFAYDVSTRNRLYGVQFGSQIAFWDRGGPWTIEGVGKAGVFGNRAAQDSSLVTLAAGEAAGGATSVTAFIGELGLTGVCRLTEHLSLRGGYRLLWIDGVALATNQVTATDFISHFDPHACGEALYHGAFAGLEYAR